MARLSQADTAPGEQERVCRCRGYDACRAVTFETGQETVTAARTFGSTAQVARMAMIEPSVFCRSSVLS